MNLSQGSKVNTPKGIGKVLYVRMAPPSYSEVASVSVILESKKNDPKYTGSIFSAQDITEAAE
jgi:hypothetical protein